jgi:hypothetical protein
MLIGSIRPQPFPRRNSIPRPPGFSRSKNNLTANRANLRE